MWTRRRAIRSLVKTNEKGEEDRRTNVVRADRRTATTSHDDGNLGRRENTVAGAGDNDRTAFATSYNNTTDDTNVTRNENTDITTGTTTTTTNTITTDTAGIAPATIDQSNTWYAECQKLRAKLQRVRLVLVIGVVAVNILVIGYILLMYFFATNTQDPAGSFGGGENNEKGQSGSVNLWRTAGLITILNGIPAITAIGLSNPIADQRTSGTSQQNVV